MLTLVLGGSASGKSEYAEQLAVAAGAPRFYIATMEPFDEECRRRIGRHRRMRAEKGFETIERYTGLEGLDLPRRGVVLLECMSNLAANEMYAPAGAGEQGALAAILRGVERLERQAAHLVVVSNDVFADGAAQYDVSTRRWLHLLGQVNSRLAARAAGVCEVVCGIPLWHKGGPR